MEIITGKQRKGLKFCLYGVEGIGKSTFASKIPGVVFIDTEGSTANMDVARLPNPTSWQMLLQEVQYVRDNAGQFTAVVIDTADWAERLCIDHICAQYHIKSIEEPGYGRGYVYLYEEFGRLLNLLSDIAEKNIHVGFTAHAMMRKFEQPDELGAYDRWELKLSKKVAPLVREWPDLLLFANYKTTVYSTDKNGTKHKVSGGQRVMYANHYACWDAKNRDGLPDEMPFDFGQVAHLFPILNDPLRNAGEAAADTPAPPPEPRPTNPPPMPDAAEKGLKSPANADGPDYSMVPGPLADLMRADGISPLEVQTAVAQRGYFPVDTPWPNYPRDFVEGVLIGAWPQVKQMCLDNRTQTPF